MRISSLSLVQYRTLTSATFEFHPQLTILLGDNGVGKTNILEALGLLSFPRSFRGSKDDQLIQWGSDFARIEGQIQLDQGIERSLVVFVNGGKKLQTDGQPQTAGEFIGQFLSTLFAPEEVDILAGPPARRRGLLDAHLSQLSSTYFIQLLHYNKVIQRRNRLLAARSGRDELDYWNQQQVVLGSAMIEARLRGIERLNLLLPPTLHLIYTSQLVLDNLPIEQLFQEKQATLLEREMMVGHSLLGPQRDDWKLVETSPIERDLGQFGSRGEQRMAVIAIKRAQLADIEHQSGSRAVLLLDDVLSELDADHQQELITSLGEQQTILTTASLTDISESLLKQAWVYRLVDGSWRRD